MIGVLRAKIFICLLERLIKHFSRRHKQTNFVVIGVFRAKYSFVYFLTDEKDFIPSEWSGTYVCPDDRLNISYVINITKSDNGIDTDARLLIDFNSIMMKGTYATFGKLLALQGQDLLASKIRGNNFNNVEINMRLDTVLTMVGAVIFTTDSGSIKTCASELHRTAGKLNSLMPRNTSVLIACLI